MNKKLILIGILLLLGVTLSGCVGVAGYGHGYGYYGYPDSYGYGYHGYSDRDHHRDWDDHHRRW